MDLFRNCRQLMLLLVINELTEICQQYITNMGWHMYPFNVKLLQMGPYILPVKFR
ncbi:hypothetical protein BJ165DRAFT_1510792 [Panaeolus papilionaceus]|nr:hypothetical protein BJ165DRAFT_1510792 [Panaeolus papilionaceus]